MTPETCYSPDTPSNISGTEEAQAVNVDPAIQASWDTAFDLVETYGGGSKHFLIGAIAAALQQTASKAAPALPQDVAALVERLREPVGHTENEATGERTPIFDAAREEAASLILSQSSTIASAREVIEPFAAEHQRIEQNYRSWGEDFTATDDTPYLGAKLTFGDLRAARDWKER